MALGSDNPFPSILLQEHVDPATPPSGHWRLFVDTDNILKIIDDAGTVSAVGGASGSVATDTIFDAKGDLAVGTGSDTSAKLTVGANDTILMADSSQTTGIKWVASQTPSTQAFSDAAAEGTADTYARGDHKHAMPANPGGGGAVTLLSTTTLGSSAASIDVSGISGSYKDLIVVAKLRGTASATVIDSWLRVGNGSVDTGSNYSDQGSFQGSSGGSVLTDSGTKEYMGPAAAASMTSGYFSSLRIEIFDYAATSTPRFIQGHHMAAWSSNRYISTLFGMWRNASAAIDIISFFPDSGNFLTGSRVYVYGRG